MSDERFDIKITDAVDGTIEPKISAIGVAADKTTASIDRLQAMLKTIDGNALNTLSAALAKTTEAEAKLTNAQANLTRATDAGAASDLQAAIAKERLAAAATAASLAEQRLATEQERTTAAAARAAIAQAAAAKATADSTAAAGAGATAAARLLKSIEDTSNTYGKSKSDVLAYRAAQAGVAADAAPFISKLREAEAAVTSVGHSSTGAQRELIVLGHEMINGNYSRFTGSLLVMAQRMNIMSLLFNPVTIGIALIIGGFVALAAAAEKTSSELAKFQNALLSTGNAAGATSASLQAMALDISSKTGESISAATKNITAYAASGQFTATQIQQLSSVTQNWADLTGQKTEQVVAGFVKLANEPGKYASEFLQAHGLITAAQVIAIEKLDEQGEHQKAVALAIDVTTEAMGRNQAKLSDWGQTWRNVGTWIDGVVHKLGDFASGADKATAAYKRQLAAQLSVPDALGHPLGSTDYIQQLKNEADQLDQHAAKAKADAIAAQQNTEAQKKAAAAYGITHAAIEQAKNSQQLYTDYVNKYKDAVKAELAVEGTHAQGLKDQAAEGAVIEAARKRFLADDVAASKKAEAAAESRAHAMEEINKKMNDELNLLGVVGPARAVQLQMDQIEEQLTNKKVHLNDAETASIRAKVEAYQTGKRVQTEMDAIYAAAVEPAQKYLDTIEAINKLVANGTITPQQGDANKALADKNNASSTIGPLYEANNVQLAEQSRLLGILGPQREIQQKLDDMRLQYLNAAKPLDEDYLAIYEKNLTLIQHKNEVDSAATRILTETVDPQRLYNSGIEATNMLLAKGIITTEQAAKSYNDLGQTFLATKQDMASGLALGALKVAADNANNAARATSAYTNIYNQWLGPARDYNALLAAANDLYAKGVINSQQYFQTVAAGQAKMLETGNSVTDGLKAGVLSWASQVGTVSQAVSQVTQNTFNSMATSLGNFVATGKGSFGDLARSILADISTMIIKFLILKAVSSFLGSWGNVSLDTPFTGAGFSDVTSGVDLGVPDVTPGSISLPGFANGLDGIVQGNAGIDRNLFQARVSQGERIQITPAGKQSNGDSSGGDTYNFTVNAPGAQAGVHQQIMQTLQAVVPTLLQQARAQANADTTKTLTRQRMKR